MGYYYDNGVLVFWDFMLGREVVTPTRAGKLSESGDH